MFKLIKNISLPVLFCINVLISANETNVEVNMESILEVGRENQTKKFFTLSTIPFKEIDMLSIIIIGNSQTTLVDEIFLTPRGYLQN